MTEARILSLTDQSDNEKPFKEQVQDAIERNKTEVIEKFKKWLVFQVDIYKATAVVLEECPLLDKFDIKFLGEWLEGEGFKVHYSRFFGSRTVVELEGDEQ